MKFVKNIAGRRMVVPCGKPAANVSSSIAFLERMYQAMPGQESNSVKARSFPMMDAELYTARVTVFTLLQADKIARACWISVAGASLLGVTLMKTAVQDLAAASMVDGLLKLPVKSLTEGDREAKDFEASDEGSLTRA